MMRHMMRLLITPPLMLAASSTAAQSQLPEPTRPGPMIPADPTIAPPLPTTDPQPLSQPPVVAPGTILPAPAPKPRWELTYLHPGEAPGTVQVTATGPRSVTLSWSAPAGAIGYWVHQAGAGQTTYYRGDSLVTETTDTVFHLLIAGAKTSARIEIARTQ